MYEAVQKCNQCGAGLTLDDLRRSDCPYCGVVLPHRAQAEQQAQVVGQVMNQMIAQQTAVQNQMRGAYGMPPVSGPPGGPPPGSSPPGAVPHYNYQDPNAIIQQQMDHANNVMRHVQRRVVFSVVGTFILILAITLLTVFL
jgi:hypothetical protein